MTSTVFIDKITVIAASWLNDVNQMVYGTFTPQTFTGTGAQTVFVLSTTPGARLQITISGIVQRWGSYALVGNTITFSEAPPYGTTIEVTD